MPITKLSSLPAVYVGETFHSADGETTVYIREIFVNYAGDAMISYNKRSPGKSDMDTIPYGDFIRMADRLLLLGTAT